MIFQPAKGLFFILEKERKKIHRHAVLKILSNEPRENTQAQGLFVNSIKCLKLVRHLANLVHLIIDCAKCLTNLLLATKSIIFKSFKS